MLTMVQAPVRLMAMILVAQMSLGSRAEGQANQIQLQARRRQATCKAAVAAICA